MKLSELWLREWVNPAITREKLCAQLTMAGLEIEECTPIENSTDYVIDISITPNRGDCLSVRGLAYEISALTYTKLKMPEFTPIDPIIQDTLPITISAPTECPSYVGRVIRDVDINATTPKWLQERLEQSGISSINPVVDIMNYVMLELGQPMHAFDLAKILGEVIVRLAKADEELTLLNGQTVKLNSDALIIADRAKPLAIAGVMGGLESGVSLLTQHIFLESAFFNPQAIARTGRRYSLSSDSSYRFERGIDPTIQVLAIERATELLLSIVGGQPGPVIEVSDAAHLPQDRIIMLRKTRMNQILGMTIADQDVEDVMNRLGFSVKKIIEGWQVTVPARRSDITLEVDLIEEVVRLQGYERLPTHQPVSKMQIHQRPETKLYLTSLRRLLCDLGYNEAITYSFVEKKLQDILDPHSQPTELMNPITAEMSVMRTNLWSGLVNALLYNQNRQQNRVRLFEVGLRFILQENQLQQQRMLSGLVCGSVMPEQWNIPARPVDFFDLKGDLQTIFQLTFASETFIFKPSQHQALHPGQTAAIYRENKWIGIMGAMHPAVIQRLGIQGRPLLFELLLDPMELASLPKFAEISKFPEIRRDLAILVDRSIPVQRIQDTIKEVANELLKSVTVFDVYQGKGIASDRKSIALALTMQHVSRTLVDEEVADLMERVIVTLKNQFAAELRG